MKQQELHVLWTAIAICDATRNEYVDDLEAMYRSSKLISSLEKDIALFNLGIEWGEEFFKTDDAMKIVGSGFCTHEYFGGFIPMLKFMKDYYQAREREEVLLPPWDLRSNQGK